MFLSHTKSILKRYKDYLGRGRGSRGVEGRYENMSRYVSMSKSSLCRSENFIMKSVTYTWCLLIKTFQNWRQLHGLSLGMLFWAICVLFLSCDMMFATVALAVQCFSFMLFGVYSSGDLSLLCVWMNLETVFSSPLEDFIGMLLGMAWYI